LICYTASAGKKIGKFHTANKHNQQNGEKRALGGGANRGQVLGETRAIRPFQSSFECAPSQEITEGRVERKGSTTRNKKTPHGWPTDFCIKETTA